jgi:hypothetical protein
VSMNATRSSHFLSSACLYGSLYGSGTDVPIPTEISAQPGGGAMPGWGSSGVPAPVPATGSMRCSVATDGAWVWLIPVKMRRPQSRVSMGRPSGRVCGRKGHPFRI